MEEINNTEHKKSILVNEEIELIREAKLGNNKAKAKLIENNQGYIISLIRKRYNTLVKGNDDLLKDLIQDCYLGIMEEALPKFDETRGVKFITYASHWIELFIKNGVKKYSNYDNDTFDDNDLESNLDEEDSFEDSDDFTNEDILTENEAFFDNPKYDSKDEIGTDEIDNLLLSILDEREIIILKMCFGINGSEKSLKEIADILNLSSERVRQLRDRALRRVEKRDKVFHDKYFASKK